jgi:predicted small integral membrane protein
MFSSGDGVRFGKWDSRSWLGVAGTWRLSLFVFAEEDLLR